MFSVSVSVCEGESKGHCAAPRHTIDLDEMKEQGTPAWTSHHTRMEAPTEDFYAADKLLTWS
jgi:hypothetical protein